MYQMTWSKSQEKQDMGKHLLYDTILQREHWRPTYVCVYVGLCRVGWNGEKFGKIHSQLFHVLSEVKVRCWSRKEEEKKQWSWAKRKRKSVFRKTCIWSQFVHLCRIMYIIGHLHKKHFQRMFKQGMQLYCPLRLLICNNNPDLPSDKLEERDLKTEWGFPAKGL